MHTYLRISAGYEYPSGGVSGCAEIAEYLADALRRRGFRVSEPEDGEFAHFVECDSGEFHYEIMVGFDHEDESTWEVSCPPVLGWLKRLFGATEQRELSKLLLAIHDAFQSDPKANSLVWFPSYGIKRNGASSPISDAS